MSSKPVTYTGGYQPATIQLHGSRTASTHATALLPYLLPGQTVLDVGCGPGTITQSLASHVGPTGHVTGVDVGVEIIQRALASLPPTSTNVTFQTADVLAGLPFATGSFDVVHAHQVLQHVPDPVAAIKEMLRVVKRPGGIVSFKEIDSGSGWIYPDLPAIRRWNRDVYPEAARLMGVEFDAGRRLPAWCRAAGLRIDEGEVVHLAPRPETFGLSPNVEVARSSRQLWAESVVGRLENVSEGMTAKVVQKGLASTEEVKEVAAAWREWAVTKDSLFVICSTEMICVLGK